MTITLNAITATMGTGSLAAIGYVANKVIKITKTVVKVYSYIEEHDLLNKAKRFWEVVQKVEQHIEHNAAALQVATDAVQIAAQPADTDPAYRSLFIKDLLRDTIAAFKIEATNIDPVYRQGAIQYVQSKVPDAFKPFVPQLFDELVQSITSGVDAAQSHDVIQAVYKIKPSA